MSDSGKVDDLYKSEDHILPSAKVRRVRLPRGQRARHVTLWYHGNLGDPADSSKRSMINNR